MKISYKAYVNYKLHIELKKVKNSKGLNKEKKYPRYDSNQNYLNYRLLLVL